MMKKRIVIGGLHHESDTFNPITTGRSDIRVIRGNELFSLKNRSSLCGEVDMLLSKGYELVPTLLARAVPNGEWDRQYYLQLKNEMLDMIKKAGRIDAFCLSLHGSMRVKDLGEAEGDLLEDIRALYPDTPIITSLDMHATVTKRMIRNCDGFVGYKTAPHVDEYETGVHAANIVIKILEEGVKPAMSAVHVPFMVAGEQSETSVEPMKSLMEYLRSVERQDKVLAASILLGFPWADTEENGVTCIALTDDDMKLSENISMEIADKFWSHRDDFKFYNETHMPDKAIDETVKLLEKGIYPVVISDSGDNPTAGSSQDVTNFLSLIIEDGRLCNLNPCLCYQGFYDPEVCSLAFDAGVGGRIKTTLGAKFDKIKSQPIQIDAKVKALVKGWKGANGTDLALIDIGGIDVVITSLHVGCYDPEMMKVLGVVPEKCKVIIVKLGYLEPEIRQIARHSMMALTTGSSDELFERLEYKKMKEKMYPIRKDFVPEFYFVK